jgi:hypothetical protein
VNEKKFPWIFVPQNLLSALDLGDSKMSLEDGFEATKLGILNYGYLIKIIKSYI